LRTVPTRFIGLCLMVLGLLAHFVAAQPQAPRPLVYVVPVEGVIDLGLAPFVARVLDDATKAGAAAVILDIDTFGGRVDAAVQIRDALLNAKVPTVAFVNKRAISAGALIGLSAQTLVMSTGSTIGAAAPVQVGLPGTAAAPVQEKTVSYVRKEFRATAEARKRPALLAEAMVDADVEVPGISEKGKLLTLTTDEALQHLVHLAGWEEWLLGGIGLVLLAVEIFIVPGFGIAGTLGIAALLGGLALSMVGAGDTWAVIVSVVWRVVLSLLAALLAGLVLLRFLPRLPLARRMILQTDLGSGPAHGSAPEADQHWLGKQGRALSVLRPAGIAMIEGARVDVVSDGEMIDADQRIQVMRVDGNRIVVRRVPTVNAEE
jgi:membrane-bound serine protease (ClpP class)